MFSYFIQLNIAIDYVGISLAHRLPRPYALATHIAGGKDSSARIIRSEAFKRTNTDLRTPLPRPGYKQISLPLPALPRCPAAGLFPFVGPINRNKIKNKIEAK